MTSPDPDTLSPADLALHEAIGRALLAVSDPELGLNIVDLGLIYAVRLTPGAVEIDYTLTTPASTAGPSIASAAQAALQPVLGGRELRLRLVMTPRWHPGLMTEDGRAYLSGYEE